MKMKMKKAEASAQAEGKSNEILIKSSKIFAHVYCSLFWQLLIFIFAVLFVLLLTLSHICIFIYLYVYIWVAASRWQPTSPEIPLFTPTSLSLQVGNVVSQNSHIAWQNVWFLLGFGFPSAFFTATFSNVSLEHSQSLHTHTHTYSHSHTHRGRGLVKRI